MPELSMTGPVYSTPHSTHTYVLTLGAGGVVFVLINELIDHRTENQRSTSLTLPSSLICVHMSAVLLAHGKDSHQFKLVNMM
jgi:hypothetical protein